MLAWLAARTGQSFRQLARQPFDLSLWTYGLLAQAEADERRAERIDLAALVRLAVLDADAFKLETERFQHELRAPLDAAPNPYPVAAARPEPSAAEIISHYDHAIRSVQWRDKDGNPVEVPI